MPPVAVGAASCRAEPGSQRHQVASRNQNGIRGRAVFLVIGAAPGVSLTLPVSARRSPRGRSMPRQNDSSRGGVKQFVDLALASTRARRSTDDRTPNFMESIMTLTTHHESSSKASRATEPLARIALTTREVRQVYGLTAAVLRQHPEIPRSKCGHRTIVFKVSDIEQFLADRAVA